jgi:hypothetical protein
VLVASRREDLEHIRDAKWRRERGSERVSLDLIVLVVLDVLSRQRHERCTRIAVGVVLERPDRVTTHVRGLSGVECEGQEILLKLRHRR